MVETDTCRDEGGGEDGCDADFLCVGEVGSPREIDRRQDENSVADYIRYVEKGRDRGRSVG